MRRFTIPGVLVAIAALALAGCPAPGGAGDLPAGPVAATGIALNKSSTTMAISGTEQLTATVAPAGATNKSVTWSTGDGTKATVSASGLLTAVAAGSATITATTADGGFTATCDVTVSAGVIHVTGVSLNKPSTTITVGNTEQLTATVAPAGATDKTVTWSSTDDTKASVSAGGLVTANAAGSATVTATTADGGFTATCDVTVSSVPTHTITFNSNGGSGTMTAQVIAEGSTANLSANGFTRSMYVFSGWSTTSNGSVAYNDKQAYVMGSSDLALYAIWTASSTLLIHYNFDNQDCTDSSGNGNDGTPSNITYVSDGNGGYSASFNGSSSYIALPNGTVKNQSAFTMMMRFKASPSQTGVLFGYQSLSAGTPTPSEFMPVIVVRSDGLLYGELWIGSDLIVHSSAPVNDGQWHTVYFSTNGSSISLYLDGVCLGTNSGAVQSLTMIYNQIGASDCDQRAYMPNANGINGWWYFTGLIDDFYFYNTALN